MTFSAPRTISSSMEHDEITDRLRTLGEQPVPDAPRNTHLHRMASVSAPAPKRFGRFAVAAAAIVGFFAGSTGLAVAGALPDPAQGVAHDVLSVVQIDVPAGKEGKRGPCVSAIAKQAELDEETKADGKAKCPKGPFGPPGDGQAPGRSGDAPGRQKADKHANDPCRGKPPWAGPGKTADERARLREEHAAARAGCPEGEENPAEAQREAAEEQREREAEAQAEQQEQQQQQQQAPPPQPLQPAPPLDTESQGEAPADPEGGDTTPPVGGDTPPAEGEEPPAEGG